MAHAHAHHGHHGHAHHGHAHHGHAHHGHAHHGHDHHQHGNRTDPAGRRALRWSLILNGAFLLIEVVAGLWTGSLALLSDAGHMVGDVSALALAYVVSGLMHRPATPTRTFGLARAEALGAFVNGLALVAVCAFIFVEAAERMRAGPPVVPGLPVLLVGAAGLAINLGSAWFLWRSASDDLNIRGALAHMLADALGSVGAMVAAALIMGFGWYWADPVVSVLVGLLVLWGAGHVVFSAARVLLDFAPAHLDADRVSATLEAVEGVAEVHDVHVWASSGAQVMVIAHVVPQPGAAPFDVLKAAEASLRTELGVWHSTIQLEPVDGCPQVDCWFHPARRRASAPEGDGAHAHADGHDHGPHDHAHGHDHDHDDHAHGDHAHGDHAHGDQPR